MTTPSLHRYLAIIVLSVMFNMAANAQQRFSKFDELPGIVKSYKPAYDESYPDWAKMLYQPDVNADRVEKAYLSWLGSHPDEKSPVLRYYKIWKRAVEPYVLADGTIQLPDMDIYGANLTKAQKMANTGLKTGNGGNSDWTFLGPKQTFWLNESGANVTPAACPWQINMYAFDVAATDNNILYGGSETGFMNKTTDNGLNWFQIGAGYPFGGGITAVAIHPEDAGIVYASAGNQIHKTTDGGLTWSPLLPASSLFYPDRLIIDSHSPDKLVSASSKGVHITNDGGATWTKRWNNASYDVEIRPDNPNVLYALSRNSTGKFEVAISSDGGNTFAAEPTFPAAISETSGGLLAVTPANPNLLFVLMLSANNTPYLYKGTVNSGTWTWTLLATGQTDNFQMNNGQGYFDLILGVSPLDPNIILAGTTTMFVSRNGGATFSVVGGYWGDYAVHPDIQDIRMLPSGKTWVSTDGGMTLTDDNFTSTTNYRARVNGLVGSDMWGFDQGWNEDLIVGGRYHNGNTAIADFYGDKALRMGGAESATGWVMQGAERHVAFNDLGRGWILPETAEGKPEGRFAFSKFPNMEEYGGRRGNILTHPNYYNVMYMGEGNSVWKTSDLGVSFQKIYTFPDKVLWMQISYSQPDILYADVVNRGLYKSEDGGYTWTAKAALTKSPNGTTYWKGKLFFAVSPYDGNRLYACLQNGTWSSDLCRIYKSDDGGNSWTNWTAGLSEYMKCIVVQPTTDGRDLVYLFTNATNGTAAHVWYRTADMPAWQDFGKNYPAGMHVNLALPFFRDSKLRVAGNGSVWESPMQEPGFAPVVNPWVETSRYNCLTDTLHFDDHSMLNHQGASWSWSFDPAPAWISDPNTRNPEVVLGVPGPYNVTLTVTRNGQTYSRTLTGMVTGIAGQAVGDCTNPARIPTKNWRLMFADSEETLYPGLATMAFDNNPATIWHTRWSTTPKGYPHRFMVDMGERYSVHQFSYLPRQDGENGRIKSYELYIGDDYENFGDPVATGEWGNSPAEQTVTLRNTRSGRYWSLIALSEVNGNEWASAAEFYVTGCNGNTSGTDPEGLDDKIRAYPVPTSGSVRLDVPEGREYSWIVLSPDGRTEGSGTIGRGAGGQSINLSTLQAGVYFIRLTESDGTLYWVKVIKN